MNLDMDEDVYERYTCKCRPYFYGINCEIFVTPDYVLEFTKPGVHNYVKLHGPTENLNEVNIKHGLIKICHHVDFLIFFQIDYAVHMVANK